MIKYSNEICVKKKQYCTIAMCTKYSFSTQSIKFLNFEDQTDSTTMLNVHIIIILLIMRKYKIKFAY